jgi:hypothetical protein
LFYRNEKNSLQRDTTEQTPKGGGAREHHHKFKTTQSMDETPVRLITTPPSKSAESDTNNVMPGI